MVDRPEWVKCIEHDHTELRGKTWCGRCAAGAFFFQGCDHAAENGRQRGRLFACPECVEAVCAALRNGHDEIIE
jgi:hypothetical protein